MTGSRKLLTIIAACAIVGAVAAWWLTGREGFTRWPNERLEQADRSTPQAEQDLLDELGVGAPPDGGSTIESRFAFGLLPGGPDPKHALSVATVVGIVVMSVTALMLAGRFWTSRTPKGMTS